MKSQSKNKLPQSLALAAASAFLAMGSARAATYDWTGATNSSFTTGSNWSQNNWAQWSDYRIGGTPTNTSLTIDGYFGIASLSLQSGLTTDIVINSTPGTNPVIMGTDQVGSASINIAADSRDLTINGEYFASTAVTWNVGAGRTLTMAGQLNNWYNPASLVKNGAGTAVLSSANGYSGGTTVNGGTLSLAVAGALPSSGGVAIGAGGKLSNDAPAGTSFALHGLTLTGGELAATNTPDTSLGNFYLQGNVTVGGTSRSTISADLRVVSNQTRDFNVGSTGDSSGVDLLISGKLGHQNNVAWGYATKLGAGTMKLSGVTELGGMTVNEGRLILEDSAIGWTFPVSGLTNNSQLEFSVTSGSRSYGANLGGSGALFKTGTGTLTLSDNNTYTGTTTISGGTLQIGNGGATGSLYSPSVSSGNLTFGSAGAIVNHGALVYNIADGSVNVNKTISGTGTLNVTGDQSVNFADGTSITTTGSQTYSATATSGRYSGFNLADDATVTLTSTAGDISMTGMLGTANGNTGNLIINTSAGNGAVTLNTPAGVPGVDFGLNALTVNAGTGTITLGTHNAQNWNHVTSISLTGGAIDSNANLVEFTTLTVTNSGASAFSCNLTAGGGALVKEGTGTLTLSGDNSYTGGTTINEGTLVATRSKLGTGPVVINDGGTLYANDQWVLNSTNPYNVAERNIGSLTINTGGTLQLDSTNGFVNGVANLYLNGGQVTGGPNDLRGDLFLYNGNQQITAGGTTTSTIASVIGVTGNNNTITVGTGSTLNISAGIKNSDWNGNGSTPGGFIKEGSGTLTLSGANSYSGVTDIKAGTLVAANSSALGQSGWSSDNMTWIRDGATLALQGGVSTADHMHVFGAGVGGLGAIRSLSGNNALTMTNGNSGSGPGYSIDSDTTIGVDADSLTVTGFYEDGGSFGLTKVGAGTLVLSQASTYTGTTTVNGGTLQLQGSGGSGTDYVGGNLFINGASTLRISGTRYNFSGETFTFNSTGGGTIDAIASGAGGMVFTVGNTFVTSGGAQNIISGTRNGAENQGFNLNSQTATFTVATGTDATSDLKVTGTLWNGGNVIKDGAGTLEFAGDQQYTGTTTVSGGTLLVNGSIASSSMTTVQTGATLGGSGPVGALTVQSGGTHNAGNSPGVQTVASATYESGSIFAWDLAGNTTTQGAGTLESPYVFDQVTVTGALDIQSGAVFRVIQNAGLDFENSFWDTTQTWSNIFSYGSLTSGWATNTAVNVYSTSNVLQNVTTYGSFTISGTSLTWTAVPELSNVLIGGLIGAGLLRRRRRA